MAKCAQSESKNVVYDLKNQDFFESSDLKKVKVLAKGTFAHAIEYLHRHDVAHIDVELENVFVCESDCAHLGDLGLAMEVTHSSRTILAAHMGGTMEYWPPEKVNADEHTRIDPFKCDIYAIGVMHWILVSGQQPEKNVDYLPKVYASTDLDLFYTNCLVSVFPVLLQECSLAVGKELSNSHEHEASALRLLPSF
ncbi:hypothetical protein RRG08_015970 [Elysia crispata]|uniref:Protein kinase domain-containing protein n=1 Tax=Elysia crispata TaxID=231223 RepID=A0AAE0YH59_9GAST|nr:hypothetical protein RRG08_015970 [Elysia crispata]